jgi:hypothetical protein
MNVPLLEFLWNNGMRSFLFQPLHDKDYSKLSSSKSEKRIYRKTHKMRWTKLQVANILDM